MRSMQQDLFTELEYEQDLGEESEDRQMVSLNRLLEKHRDISLNGLLEKHRDEEVLLMIIHSILFVYFSYLLVYRSLIYAFADARIVLGGKSRQRR